MSARKAARAPALDIERIRRDFPILGQQIHGKPLVYLDSAATSQKPRAVIDAVARFYLEDNANVHRGVHLLSERATRAYEDAREKVRRFLGARHAHEIVFVRGTTEAVNLVAQTLGRMRVRQGDEILITEMEHHSNIVPWQMLCEEKGASLRVAPIDDEGQLRLEDLERLLGPRTRLLALSHVSNALGTVNPAARIVELAHRQGVPVLLDGAQAAPHLAVDVQALGCDFYAFSGHKLFGPTGIGALYARAELLEEMPPWQGGGDMIRSVTFEKTTWNRLPYKFEAGTPDIAGAVGLGAAIDYIGALGMPAIAAHEQALLSYATAALCEVPGLRLIGTAKEKVSVLSFQLGELHPHDVGTVLDGEGIAIRTGHHCAQPLMRRLGVSATARASLALYNRREDIDALVAGLHGASRTLL
ncbi:MAG TPA: cysteine desulfurase [Myxococcales bacterium]|nr:cysteine desulfurase [Myxococcales bacterium]HET9752014.1 cysteine desulfurase [Myxococcales bacterium]